MEEFGFTEVDDIVTREPGVVCTLGVRVGGVVVVMGV